MLNKALEKQKASFEALLDQRMSQPDRPAQEEEQESDSGATTSSESWASPPPVESQRPALVNVSGSAASLTTEQEPLETRPAAIAPQQQWFGQLLGLSTPVAAETRPGSGLHRLVEEAPPASTQMHFPVHASVRRLWEDARRARTRPLAELSQTVRQCYRVPPDDWAFLGARRRPDDALVAHCRGRVKETSKGTILTHNEKSQEKLDQVLADTVATGAHMGRPLAFAVSAADQVGSQLEQARTLLASVSGVPDTVFWYLDNASRCAGLALEAVMDVTETVARQNAGACRRLRESWVEASTLPEAVKRQVLATDVVGGMAPSDPSAKFSAPLVGEVLPAALEAAVDSAKQHVALADQAKLLKPAQTGTFKMPKRPPKSQGGSGKKIRYQSPVVPPATETRAEKAGYTSPSSSAQPQRGRDRDQRRRGRGKGQGKSRNSGPRKDKQP